MESSSARSPFFDKALGERTGAAQQLSFALYGAANRMARLHKPYLEPIGLTFSQYLVFLELFAGGRQTVGDLGAKLGMDGGTITPLLKRLAAAGKITRKRDEADERRVLVDLTPAGDALRAPVHAIAGQIRSACRLCEADIPALRRTLDELAWPAG